MLPQDLYHLLQGTVQADSNIRTQAEQHLKALESSSGFLSIMLQISCAPESDATIKQAAAIYFKNVIRSGWESSISSEERAWIKQNILNAAANSHGNQRSIFLNAIANTLSFECNNNTWPEYIPSVLNLISSADHHVAHGGLLALLEFIKHYQWYQSSRRGPINDVIKQIFPNLLALGNNLVQTDNIQAVEILKSILKIYSCSIRMELSAYHMDQNNIMGWVQLLTAVIQKNVPVEATAGDFEKNPWWKGKKWAYTSLNQLLQRYCRVRKTETKYNAFAKYYLASFAPQILLVHIEKIKEVVNGAACSNRNRQQLLTYLENCIKPKLTWAKLEPHVEFIVSGFVYPLLCFSKEDLDLWNEDEVEYIHKKIDPPIDDYKSPVNAAEEFLKALVKDRFKTTFIPIITIINGLLTQYSQAAVEVKDPKLKYGMLRMMCTLGDQTMKEESPVKAHLEQFLVTHVFPEFSSPNGFMRAIACDCLLEFGKIHFQDKANLQFAFSSVFACIKDKELPVRVMGALALYPFFSYKEISDALKPHAASLMQELLNLTNEIDMDTLTHIMEKLVFEFTEELIPFSVKLATQLRDTFMRIVGEANFSSEDFDLAESEDKTLAAMGVLKTLASLLLAVDGSTSILLELQNVIFPAVKFVLEHSILDLYEEIFEIIDTAIFCAKGISPVMWELFPLIVRTCTEDAVEYLAEMLPSLKNYIAYGAEVFTNRPDYMNDLIQIIQNTLNPAHDYIGDSDRIRACQLIEFILMHWQGKIDILIPQFISIAQHYLSGKIKTSQFRVHCLEIVMNCILYNPSLALKTLETTQFTAPFFTLWFKNIENLSRVHDKKLSVCALAALLEMPELPPALQNQHVHLFDGVLQTLKTYPSALQERDRLERIENGEENPDVDDGFEDAEDEEVEGAETEEGYLEYLQSQAAANRPDDDDDDDWSVAEFTEEDIYFTTPLDQVDLKQLVARLLASLSQRGIGAQIESALSQENKSILQNFTAKT